MTTRPRRCFADSAHDSHEWRTFGAGNAGVWRCDGIPEGETIVLTRGADGVYRLPDLRPRRFIAFDPADMRTPLLAYTVGGDDRLFTKEWIA